MFQFTERHTFRIFLARNNTLMFIKGILTPPDITSSEFSITIFHIFIHYRG